VNCKEIKVKIEVTMRRGSIKQCCYSRTSWWVSITDGNGSHKIRRIRFALRTVRTAVMSITVVRDHKEVAVNVCVCV
jgi:hypothetical protein